ncbi:EKC/KEOPS complex subunit TP53RK [Eurosta solidaginis]|uniref:EKC/KEOPS complex subunit TP53RK n=1 Tax=Eurosta solidaginis TaxID=178769 RepID=UPI003530BD38
MDLAVFKQGAEGRLYVSEYNGVKCLVKERFVKNYRHMDLDTQITRNRIKAETKAATRCKNAGILAPRILHADLNTRKIYMEYFENAITAKDYIQRVVQEYKDSSDEVLNEFCTRIGSIIGKLHRNNIIHGDLTTSNILINPKGDDILKQYEIALIDFGLSHYNQGVEDKAVDLYVLERALLSTHSEQPYLFGKILTAYRQECGKNENAVVSKFEEVRARGRKRNMIG